MKKWEYMCQRIPCDSPDLEQGLDKLGRESWEMVGTGRTRTGFSATSEVLILFFKREVPEPPAPASQKSEFFENEVQARIRQNMGNPQP